MSIAREIATEVSKSSRWSKVTDLLAIILLVLFAWKLQNLSVARFDAGLLQGDLAAIWQSIYNVAFNGSPNSSFNCSVHEYYSLLGRPNLFDPSPAVVDCHQLGVHFHALTYPIALLARLFPTPLLLLLLQTLALTLAGLILYILSNRWLHNRALALCILVSFLLNPFTHGLNLNEFHFDAFYPLLIFAAVYSFDAGKRFWFWATVATILCVKESGCLIVFGLGCLLLVQALQLRRNYTSAAILLVLGPLSLYLITEKIMPMFSFTGAYMFGGIYGCKLGASAGQILTTLMTQPALAAEVILTKANGTYLALLIGSTSLLAFARPQYLLVGGPLLFVNLITSNPTMKLTVGQYSAAVFPAFYLAFAAALRTPPSLWRRSVTYGVLTCSIALNVKLFISESAVLPPLPDPTPYRQEISALQQIPSSAAVCTDAPWISYVASRREVFLTPVNISRCTLVVWDKAPQWYVPAPIRQQVATYLAEHFEVHSEFSHLILYRRKS